MTDKNSLYWIFLEFEEFIFRKKILISSSSKRNPIFCSSEIQLRKKHFLNSSYVINPSLFLLMEINYCPISKNSFWSRMPERKLRTIFLNLQEKQNWTMGNRSICSSVWMELNHLSSKACFTEILSFCFKRSW